MEDRWPYPVPQAMQRQTGRGHKPARPIPADISIVPEPEGTDAPPRQDETGRAAALQSGPQPKD